MKKKLYKRSENFYWFHCSKNKINKLMEWNDKKSDFWNCNIDGFESHDK